MSGREAPPAAFAEQESRYAARGRPVYTFPEIGIFASIFWNVVLRSLMIVIGTDVVERYFSARAGHKGIRAARTQYEAWLAIAMAANWKTPADVKMAHPKASILRSGRVVFNVKANDYRLVALVQYRAGVLMIRFFGSHREYDAIDAENV